MDLRYSSSMVRYTTAIYVPSVSEHIRIHLKVCRNACQCNAACTKLNLVAHHHPLGQGHRQQFRGYVSILRRGYYVTPSLGLLWCVCAVWCICARDFMYVSRYVLDFFLGGNVEVGGMGDATYKRSDSGNLSIWEGRCESSSEISLTSTNEKGWLIDSMNSL